jgi:hypothetical protein
LHEETNYLSEYELRRNKNIEERKELERNLFSGYWGGEGRPVFFDGSWRKKTTLADRMSKTTPIWKIVAKSRWK